MLRSKLTLGAALIGAGLLAGCAYEPAPGYYSYNEGYYADPGYYSYDPAYYSYGYDPGYYDYGYGYGYGPAFYGYYDAYHHWHNRGDRDWNRADWQRYRNDYRFNGTNAGVNRGGTRDWHRNSFNNNSVNAAPRENFSHSTAQAPTPLGSRGMHEQNGDRRDWNH